MRFASPSPYDTLLDDLVVGSRVQLGDGAISMSCVAVDVLGASAIIETGGHANGQPGVHLSSETLRLTTPTEEDLVLAETMAAAGVEYIAVSFVRQASDIDEVRAIVGDRAQLVAKIETHTSINNLHDVVAASDAIMVARGDLGIDCPIEDVPHLQKRVVRHCVETGTPVITATQMLESMITAPSPTRAEVSDIANAVFDGTDAVMLSGETAIGRDPIGVVRTMAESPSAPSPRPATGSGRRASGECSAATTISISSRSTGSPRRSPTPHGRRRSTPRPRPSSAAPAAVARRGRWPGSGRKHG